MWRAVGLLLAALCMVANANLILDDQCPTTDKKDEYYDITDGSGKIEIKLNDIPLEDENGARLENCDYPVGDVVQVGPGSCDITCQACDDFDNCCTVGYTITATVVDPCPTTDKEDEYYYLTDSLPYRWVTTSDIPLESPNGATLSGCNYPINKSMRIAAGECDIICQACDDVTDKCCEVSYTIYMREKKCSAEEDVANGQFALDNLGGRLIGDTATITCDDGSETTGNPQVTCGADGVDFEGNQGAAQEVGQNLPVWQDMPTCPSTGDTDIPPPEPLRRPQCGDPDPAGPNGDLDFTDTTIGATATYTCDPGFLPSSSVVSCEEIDATTAAWSDIPPTCQEIQCEDPVNGPNGQWQVNGNALDETATYSCDEGYRSNRPGTEAVCRLSGDGQSASFSEDAPGCEEIQCEDPVNGPNGQWQVNGNALDETATYSCDEGYRSNRPGTEAVCRLSGDGQSASFSEDAPGCEEILCDDPINGANGQWRVNGNAPGETATYSCDPGYQSDSPVLDAVCRLSGDGQSASWSEDAPGCEEVIVTRCPDGFTAVGKRCYRLISEEDTWENQCGKCRAAGGELAVPHSNQELEWQAQFHSGGSTVWLGIHSMIRVNEFMDMASQSVVITNWLRQPAVRRPTHLPGPDCVSAGSDGRWTNECCYVRRAAICEADPIGQPECNNAAGYELVGGRCLKYSPRPATFEQKCKDCERHRGQLATALNENDAQALETFFTDYNPSVPAWFSLHDIIRPNQFQTVSLEAANYFNWAGSGPSGNGDCVALTEGGWRDQCCYDLKPAVCELKFCPENYRQIGDNCFRLIGNPSTWDAAQKICRKDGANLAMLESMPYVEDVWSIIGGRSGSFWIGVHDQVTEGNFQTPTLQPLSFPHWASGVPGHNIYKDCGFLGPGGVEMECCYAKLPAMCARKTFQ